MGLSDKKLCCIVSGKRCQQGDTPGIINYILLKDSNTYCITLLYGLIIAFPVLFFRTP